MRPDADARTHTKPTPGGTTAEPHAETCTDTHTETRRDLRTALCGVLLVAVAAVVGTLVQRSTGSIHLNWPPLYANWRPHLGPGTPAALAVAAAVVAYGPSLAVRLGRRALLWATWGASLAWIWSLALIDGWHRGVAERLTTKYEYLQVIDRFGDIPATLRDFTAHILIDSPDNWPAHVAGHPPGAALTFVLLDRIGLGGGAWAGVFCITAGSTAAVAVLLTVRALAGDAAARKAAPFVALAPAAIWIGASADGYFAAVTAWTAALLALAATRTVRRPALAATGAGLLFGLTTQLSYGLPLFAIVLLAVLLLTRAWRPVPWFLAGATVFPVLLALPGFNWWESYHLLVERYYQGAGGVRPYAYFLWANPACTVLAAGLAALVGLRRTLHATKGLPGRLRTGGHTPADGLTVLLLAALLTLAVADLSGMSKAETERIWLPFIVFLLPAAALLPARSVRWWLAVQAATALALNHLLFTGW